MSSKKNLLIISVLVISAIIISLYLFQKSVSFNEKLVGQWKIQKVVDFTGEIDSSSAGMQSFTFHADSTLEIGWSKSAIENDSTIIQKCKYQIIENELVLFIEKDNATEFGHLDFQDDQLVITDSSRSLRAYLVRQ